MWIRSTIVPDPKVGIATWGMKYGQPIDRLLRESIRAILLGLRATGIQPARVYSHGRNPAKQSTKSS